MDPVIHFWGPFFRATSLSLAVPMTRHQRKVDRDFSSINVENTYNVECAGRMQHTCLQRGVSSKQTCPDSITVARGASRRVL